MPDLLAWASFPLLLFLKDTRSTRVCCRKEEEERDWERGDPEREIREMYRDRERESERI